ncbi:MAG: STAS domain-containing protein [Acidobacteria bacterium]|nr:STAS domain-containing protein [Acidobacteriota bacterium]
MQDTRQWQEDSYEGAVVISLDRGLKGGVEAALKEHIDDLVREGNRQILINLERLPYVDSTELGRLIRCHLSVRQAGGRVRLCHLSDRVKTLLRMTRLDTVFEIYESVDEALRSLRKDDRQDEAAPLP